jgi:phage baseplate assembly protein W
MVTMIARPSQAKVGVVWLDVNTKMGASPKPDLLPDVQAINNSIYNLFRCPIGARGPIFQPEYGANLYRLLHEPLDYNTANKVKMFTIQALQRWEPRILIDFLGSGVIPVLELPGFQVRIQYTIVATQSKGEGTFILSKAGPT